MFRLITAAAVLALAAPAVALAQDPHGAHAGHQPSGDHAGHAGMDHGGHAGMDHSGHVASAAQSLTTVPADGSMLMGPPESFSITFPHAMRLTDVTVQAHGQAAVAVAVPEASAGTGASVALPALTPATYTLTWTAQGEDGHQMTGTVGFMVH
ncbi:MAG: copper resistance protein CopC [Caulobacterales bacterium]|nr:copper resistance protein CopC [Caulobacterales bacterium]